MRKAILDTSFILNCIREKVDFFEELEKKGIMPLIPTEVIKELERVSKSNKKKQYKENARISLEIIKNNEYKEINIGKGHVDKKIKEYADERPEILVATTDKKLKSNINNKKISLIRRNKIDIKQ